MIVRGGILDESHVIISSYNHFIIMRTYRWPYGLCSSFSCLDCYFFMGIFTNYTYDRRGRETYRNNRDACRVMAGLASLPALARNTERRDGPARTRRTTLRHLYLSFLSLSFSLSLLSKIRYGLGNCLSEREKIDTESFPVAFSGESRDLPYRELQTVGSVSLTLRESPDQE